MSGRGTVSEDVGLWLLSSDKPTERQIHQAAVCQTTFVSRRTQERLVRPRVHYDHKDLEMINARAMLEAAENCLDLAGQTKDEWVRRRIMRMAVAWQDLAELQVWLEGQVAQADTRAEIAKAA